MKALEGAFNQEKALVGAFPVIVKTGCGTDGALHSTSPGCAGWCNGDCVWSDGECTTAGPAQTGVKLKLGSQPAGSWEELHSGAGVTGSLALDWTRDTGIGR